MIRISEVQVPKINGAGETDGMIERPLSDEDLDKGFATANPDVILQAIDQLAPGEYVIIQNITPAKVSRMTEYYCRKDCS